MRTRSLQIQGAWLVWLLLVETVAAQDALFPGESAPQQGSEGADIVPASPAPTAPEASTAPQAEGPPTVPSQAVAAPAPAALPTERSVAAPSTAAPLPTQADVAAPSQEAALAAELEAAARVSSSEDLAKPELLRFYGFLDFGARYFYDVDAAPQGKPVLFTPTGRESGGWSFTPATTNLYIDAQPLPSTRALVELRFALQGSDPKRPRYVASTADVSSPFAQGISSVATLNIERVQIEQHIFDWFQLRAGMWLTPFGIWNEDHGTPTLISMYLPQFILNEQIPLRQVGVQSYGGARIGDYRVDYNAYVSNGRLYSVSAGGTEASIHDVVDYDSDKSVGYRLRFSRSYPFYFHVSNAFYYGKYEEISREIETVTGPGTGKTVGWREYSIALDAALDYKGMRLRSEFIVTATRYEPGFEPTYREGVQPDRNQYDGYLLAAYRLQSGLPQLEPYFYWELARRPSGIGDTFVIGSLGLNYYLSAVSQLKIQWITAAFFDWNSKPGAAWLGLPTRSNDYHTGKDLPSATGSPGAISARYVLTF